MTDVAAQVERPIRCSGLEVRAILAGRKTQLRRVITNRFGLCDECWFRWSVPHNHNDLHNTDGTPNIAAAVFGPDPYLRVGRCDHRDVAGVRERFGASVGDRLWVREAWATRTDIDASKDPARAKHYTLYRADGAGALIDPNDWHDYGDRWRPSIHMPRWASRLTLRVTSVRVERLHAITEEDAIAEGARRFDDLPSRHPYGHDPRWSLESPTSVDQCLGTARHAFGNLWDAINGKRVPWASNPWVWVVGFEVVS